MQIYFGSKFSSNLLAHFMNNRAYALIFYTGVCVWKNAFDTLEYISSSPNIFLTNGHWINIFKSRVRAGVNRQCAGQDQEGSAVSNTSRSKRAARSSNTLGHSVPRYARYQEGLGKYLSWLCLPSAVSSVHAHAHHWIIHINWEDGRETQTECIFIYDVSL